MSSTIDYSKLKVTELRDALQKRNLPITGVKAELIARLTSADATSDAPSPAANKTHLPTADDYEVDWDDNDDPAPVTTTTTASTTAPVAVTPAEVAPKPAESTAAAKTATEEKPKKKFASIAALFGTPATAATTTPAAKTPTKPAKDSQNSQSPSSPSTVSDEAGTSTVTSAPAKPEPSFAAGLEASSLDVELERRKARAKRFGMDEDTTTNEATKKLEREKRFGNAAAEDVPEKKEVVKGLDSALPEHRRERKRGPPTQSEGGRGGKRSRGGNNNGNNNGSGAGRGGDRERRPQVPRRATGGGIQKPSSQKSGGYKAVLDDPTEKAKAEARARKFGVA